MGAQAELAHLGRLKAPAAARALPALGDRARQEECSYERFVQTLLETEVSARDSRGDQARIRQPRFRRDGRLEDGGLVARAITDAERLGGVLCRRARRDVIG